MTQILIIMALQALGAVLMAGSLLPRETALFLTAVMVIFVALRPLADGLKLLILSIPLFFALPITETFDTMANWRLVSAALFLRYAWEVARSGQLRSMLKAARHSALFWGAAAFLGWGAVSLSGASHPIVGLRKLLFLANIFLLFPVAYRVAGRGAREIWQHCLAATGITLAVGYAQFISVFFVPLQTFWHFWSERVIPLWYGTALGALLKKSNTWFSYYADAPPTLRVFSVFPDSHSFALFILLGLIGALALVLAGRPKNHLRAAPLWLILASLLALVLSGSRGVWASAIITAVLGILALRLLRASPLAAGRGALKTAVLIFFVFGSFFFPASVLLGLSQRSERGGQSFLALERARSITDLEESSNRSRLQIWQEALSAVGRAPLSGVGLGNFSLILGENITAARQGASAHNLYLDIAAETGIPGLAFFLLLVGVLVIEPLRKTWRDGWLVSDPGILAALIGFTVYIVWALGYSFFDVVLFNDKVLLFATVISGTVWGEVFRDATHEQRATS